MPRLSKRVIDGIKPGEKDAVYWDDDLKGFGLRVKPTGVKSFLCQYRNEYGKSKRYTIAKFGVLTADEARAEAKRILGSVAYGDDPVSDRDKKRKDLTVAELCDVYLKEGCETKKASTISTDIGRIERHIKPLVGQKAITELTKADVQKMMRDIANGKTAKDVKTKKFGRAIVTGGKGTATKAVRLLGAIFTFAKQHELRDDNPAHGIVTYTDKKNERFLDTKELERIGVVIANAENDGSLNSMALNILKLLLLTGCRKSEISGLEWSWIDWERNCLRLPDAKTGARLVGLGETALTLLGDLPKLHPIFVFPSSTGKAGYQGTDKVWRNEVRRLAQVEDVRIHDLRHTFASVAGELGYSQPTIGALLGHAGMGTTGRYIHFGRDPLGAAATEISRVINDRLVGEKP